ncbi:5629_t:CDS:1 [Ambispora leptoticha]|uniref:5629_t:CDS:1 n=1 Tax=Ambispora leptoticha TaxID=144679 RepID=A0A9N8ZN34_9GLOM|nr:5629_t:CDS:1 [Ambispora leptoticha]
MASTAPPEILQEIFLQLTYNADGNFYTSDLHSCILVNRQWCASAIALLWSEPFGSSATLKNKRYESLIEVYLLFLPLATLAKLLPQTVLRRYRRCPPPKFEYPHFAKHINFDGMYKTVEKWCSKRYLSVAYMEKIYWALFEVMRRSGACIVALTCHVSAYPRDVPQFLLKSDDGFQEWLASVRTCCLVCDTSSQTAILFDALPELSVGVVSYLLKLILRLEFIKTYLKSYSYPHKQEVLHLIMYDPDVHSNRTLFPKHMGRFRRLQKLTLHRLSKECEVYLTAYHYNYEWDFFLEIANLLLVANIHLPKELLFSNKLVEVVFRRCRGFSHTAVQQVLVTSFPKLRKVTVIDCEDACQEFVRWADEINQRAISSNDGAGAKQNMVKN